MSKEVQEAKERLQTICAKPSNKDEYINANWLGLSNIQAIEMLLQELDKLQKQVELKDKYSELIIDIGFDYDGYSKAESLKELIDELVNYAKASLKNEEVEE